MESYDFDEPPSPAHPPPMARTILFCHPAYTDFFSVLLTLPKLEEDENGQLGVHYGTAHTACAILAANAFNGFFSIDREGTERVDPEINSVLTQDKYYFFVDGADDEHINYPVVPSFLDWEFPHDRIPTAWTQAVAYAHTSPKSPLCGLTQFSLPVETAYLVPYSQKEWFATNAMARYATGIHGSIDDTCNHITLRKDLHFLFDQGHWCIAPKTISGIGNPGLYGFMVVRNEYIGIVHDTEIRGLHKDCIPFLFARFAWTVFLGARSFFASGYGRYVRVLVPHIETTGKSYQCKTMSGDDLIRTYGDDKLTGATTRKRSRGDGEETDQVSYFVDLHDNLETVTS